MSTFDPSSADPTSVPRPPLPATPTLAMPAAWLSPYLLEPSFSSPFGLLKVASASWATGTVWPAPNVAMIVPSAVMLTLSICPAADPFWLIDELVDAAVYDVSDAVVPSNRSHVTALTVAPLVQVVGPARLTSATGAVNAPVPLNVTDPSAPIRTVPAVVPAVPVASVLGTVTS